jgi:cytochrome P450
MSVYFSRFRDAVDALQLPDLRQSLYDAGDKVMRDALITLHGDAHRQRRIVEMGVFGRGFFRAYLQNVFAPRLEALLSPALLAGKAEIIDLGMRLSMHLTADFAGIDRDAAKPDDTSILLDLVRVFSEGATLVHSTRDHAVVNAEVDAAMVVFEQRFFRPSLERRKKLVTAVEAGTLERSALPHDVLTTLLLARRRIELSDDVLRREMSFFLQAGAHSTTNSAAHAYHEIITWAAIDPARRTRLTDPAFVQRCVHESLRLHPASPVAARTAVTACKVGRCPVAQGESVEIQLAQANRDPEVFGANADAFDPDRRLPPDVRPWGLSFGYGMHACLGRDLDGGIVGTAGTPGGQDAPHFGTVPLFVHALLAADACPDPQDPPVMDARTLRRNWGRYPVRFHRRPS